MMFFRRLGYLLPWRRRAAERDMQEELRSIAAMADPRELGNLTLAAEDVRAQWGWTRLEQTGQDLRYALRQLRRGPGFAAIVIATLALGIGGTTAVFSVVQAVLFAPLPYTAAGQLVRFYQEEPTIVSSRTRVTGPHFKEIRNRAASFESIAALKEADGIDLTADGQAQRLRVLRVTSGYFRTLRADPLRGRTFEPADEGGASRVILSHALWRTRFGSDETLLGATVLLSAEPFVVVGVAPPGFEDPIVGDVDAWLPYDLVRNTNQEDYTLTAIGRLRDGVSFDRARADITALSDALAEAWPGVRASTLIVRPLKEDLVAPSRGTLNALLVAVGLVLLVACVNVANMFLVRATGRTREFAVRAALGAGGARLARQLLVESLLLAAAGGLFGIPLSVFGVDALRAIAHEGIPRLDEVRLDPVVLAFATLVTLAAALGVGTMAAIRFARIDASRALREHSRSSAARGYTRLRSGLAAAQLALALALLSAAGVLMVSVHRLQRIDLGFRAEGVLTFELSLPAARYDAARRAAFHEELARRLEGLPGVTRAGGTSHLPAIGTRHAWPVRVDSGPLAGTVPKIRTGGTDRQAENRFVSGHFFAALGIPLLAGRTFGPEDDRRAPPRAVVSADFARQAFPGMALDEVVGQQIAIFSQRNAIIGVVGDVALDAYGAPGAAVYRAQRQHAASINWTLTQVVATGLPPARMLDAVRAEVAALDPQLVVYRAAPMIDVVGRGSRRERLAAVLMGTFASVSLLLAALGLYGVLAHTVRERTAEIGIRMALGATTARIRALVLRQVALILGAGLVIGSAGALMLGTWLTSLVFQIRPSDPGVLLATASLLTVTGLFAAWLPARRASRVEPRVAIQEGL